MGPTGAAGPAGPTGARGPQGPPGAAARLDSIGQLNGAACTTAAGLPGVLAIGAGAGDTLSLHCRPAPLSEALPHVVLNEIDYDQVGVDAGGFVELANTGLGVADLTSLAIVLVDGADGREYGRIPLSGSIPAGGHLSVAVDAQNGAPDGVALYDTASRAVLDAFSYEGAVTLATIDAITFTLVEGTALSSTVADSNTVTGSLARLPNGTDTDNASADWAFTTTPTPGASNVLAP